VSYKCALCMISPGSESPIGTREEIIEHIRGHGSSDIGLWLTEASEQTDLKNFA